MYLDFNTEVQEKRNLGLNQYFCVLFYVDQNVFLTHMVLNHYYDVNPLRPPSNWHGMILVTILILFKIKQNNFHSLTWQVFTIKYEHHTLTAMISRQ